MVFHKSAEEWLKSHSLTTSIITPSHIRLCLHLCITILLASYLCAGTIGGSSHGSRMYLRVPNIEGAAFSSRLPDTQFRIVPRQLFRPGYNILYPWNLMFRFLLQHFIIRFDGIIKISDRNKHIGHSYWLLLNSRLTVLLFTMLLVQDNLTLWLNWSKKEEPMWRQLLR